MKIRVSFQNSGGELDHRIVDSEQAASFAAGEMIEDAGELHHGDKITVTELDEEDTSEPRLADVENDDFNEDRHLA